MAISLTMPYSLQVTGYIDARMRGVFSGTVETRRPVNSVLHCNQYETNGFFAPGAATSPVNAGDDDLDQSVLPVIHVTIPNHPTVQQILLGRLRTLSR